MSEIAINRIMSQISKEELHQLIEPVDNISSFLPITKEELKLILCRELLAEKTIEIKEEEKVLKFENIYDFTAWYQANLGIFSQEQQVALNSLIEFRDTIDAGCICKRATREIKAHQYFEQFWLKNNGSDLLPTLAQKLNLKSVSVNS